jgi:tetratricopeptide (TPR) repeat protein
MNNGFNKKIRLSLFVFLMPLFILVSTSSAEKIYCKDGKIIAGEIAYRTKNSIFLRQNNGSFGVPLTNIEKIVNDDGTISKFDYDYTYKLLQENIRSKNYVLAINACSELLSSIPDSYSLHYLRGMFNQKSGNSQDALKDYNFLVQQNKADYLVMNNIGVIYANSNLIKEASDAFSQAIKLNPYIAKPHENLAGILFQLKDYPAAAEEYSTALTLDPGNAKTMYYLARVYIEIGDYDAANGQLEKALTINNGDVLTKNALEYLKSARQKPHNLKTAD